VAVFGEAIGTVETDVLSGGPGPVPGADVVLGAGSVDGFCEQLVAGTAEDGDVLVALGSTLVVWMTVPGWPAEVPGLWRAPHLVAGKAMLGGASNAGGMWADWADRALRPPPAGPSAGGGDEDGPDQVPLWWPWANGERVPWHDRSLRIAMSGADLSFGPGPLRRGVYEATGFVVRHIVERAARCGTTPQRFIVSGGGMANPDWVQALADVLGQAVLPMAVPEGAALGAAFLARMAAGLESSLDDARRWARWSAEVEPRPAWAQAANQRYQRWRESLPGAE
jgi:xylulokinase